LKSAPINEGLKPNGNRIVPKVGDYVDVATWLVFNNWWKLLAGDQTWGKDWYIAIGHCWKEDPAIELTKKWKWIV
jgi:hypothetical protein